MGVESGNFFLQPLGYWSEFQLFDLHLFELFGCTVLSFGAKFAGKQKNLMNKSVTERPNKD